MIRTWLIALGALLLAALAPHLLAPAALLDAVSNALAAPPLGLKPFGW